MNPDYRSTFKLFIISAAAFLVVGVIILKHSPSNQPRKINGVSFVAPVRPVGLNAIKPIKKVNASWIAITPYAFSEAGKPGVSFNYDRQWWGERTEGVAQTISLAKKLGLNVMLKPHVWVHGQGWTGDFELQGEGRWRQWEKDYTNYILHFARTADSLGVDLLCIGTEYSKAAVSHPQIWRRLIKKVRSVYSGKLTYAANWDSYEKISFWDELDYIGIDAYFPLSDKRNPGLAYLKQQWKPLKSELQAFSANQQKPILFTEFGYQSVDFAADGHWKYKRKERAVNEQAQVRAYKAIFETFWPQDWFAGGFLWKWYDSTSRHYRNRPKGYTPQSKLAEQTLRAWYGQFVTGDE